MKMQEVANHLRQYLPARTDRFHDILPIASISATSTVATVTTSANHGLVSGHVVALVGVETRTPIAAVSKSALLTTFTTSADHDLTEGNPDTPDVALFGFDAGDWNASHELVNVANRRTFTVKNLFAEPTLNGSEVLLEPNRVDGINGTYSVTVASKTTFTISGSFVAGTYTPVGGKVIGNPRIFVAASLERATAIYLDQPERFACFVIPGEAVVSKDRASLSDAVAAKAEGDTLRLRLLDEFSIFVYAPCSDEHAGELAVDICRHELLGPIIHSLYGLKFDTGLACPESDFRLVLTGHGIFFYNPAYLVHGYHFQAPSDLTDDDAAERNQSRAFRDIDLSILGAHTPLTATVNLDEDPL